jgi:hypothetical protein
MGRIDDVAGRPTEHLLGFFADRQNPLAACRRSLDRHHRRLIGDDAAPFDKGQRRRRTQVNGKVIREQP